MWNNSLRNFSAAGVLVLLVAAATSAWALPETGRDEELAQRVERLSQQVYRERVLELPEDAGVWHTIVVYPTATPSDASSRQLAAALASEERLRSLVAQTKTHVYATTDPLWQQRLQKHYGVSAPAIIVQQPSGRVCYKASGANLPGDATQLADQIATSIGNCRPKPAPTPQPAPVAPPATSIPDIGPQQPATSGDDSHVLWMIVVPILAGLGGLLQEWKQSNA